MVLGLGEEGLIRGLLSNHPQAFFQQVHAGYQRRASEDPARFAHIDASLAREAVWAAVRQAVARRGWL